jgi:hypothetical protein
LVDRLGTKEPEFGSYAGQLGIAHGGQQSAVHFRGHPAPSLERESEEIIMVEVLIEEIFGSD